MIGSVINCADNTHISVQNSLFEKHKRPQSHHSKDRLYKNEDMFHKGGVIYAGKNATLSFINCTFRENHADAGAIAYVEKFSSVYFENCIFRRNEANRRNHNNHGNHRDHKNTGNHRNHKNTGNHRNHTNHINQRKSQKSQM